MKTTIRVCLLCSLVLSSSVSYGQQTKGDRENTGQITVRKSSGIISRAGGTHNKSNIGSFFENRGKLYARRVADGPTFDWPIGSGHEYVYRANPFVGIPGNVIQGRFTTDEEWEAADGYNNRDSARVAFSDKPVTWPSTGWPVKDATGKPVFVSNQDSYCVYNDSTNSRGILNFQMNQTGYAFSDKSVRDMVIYIFDVINKSTTTYDNFYFGLYADIDIGGSETAYKDYANDRIAFDRSLNRVYFYDNGVSKQWNGPAGVFGYILLQSPKVGGVQRGITDLHYNLYDDDLDVDSVQYGILSSAPSLAASALGPRYFHNGANAPDLHYDDPNTIPPTGLDLVSLMGSGPYHFAPGDTLRFITAFVAANDAAQMDSITAHAYNLYRNNFVIAQPPDPPKVTVVPGDKRVSIAWDSRSELSRDPFTGNPSFQGYRLYKSVDKGGHWDQIDRNVNPGVGADPVPLAIFDKTKGLQHSYIDSNVTNGLEYWYSVTAYSPPTQTNRVLESSRGFTSLDLNIGVAVPRSSAVGRAPASATTVRQTGTGTANVVIAIEPLDIPQAGANTFDVKFAPVATLEQGTLRSVVQTRADSVGTRTSHMFSCTFTSPVQYVLRNLTEGTLLVSGGTYASGVPIVFEGVTLVLTDTSSVLADRPKAGDSLVIRLGVRVVSGATEVLPLQPLHYGTRYVTSNGVVFSIVLGDTTVQHRITYKDQFTFSTTAAQLNPNITSGELDRIKVVPNPYLVSSTYEAEFGTLRREPIRVLRFNNLPARCTIYIFSLAGDKVKTIDHNSDNGTESWDLRADGNREIAPGVYIFLVKTATAEKIGRFAVIK